MIPHVLRGQPLGGAALARWLPAGSIVFNGATGQIVGAPWTLTGQVDRVGSSAGLLSATGATGARYDAGKVIQAQPGAMTVIAVVRRTAGSALHYVAGTVSTGTSYLEHLIVNADSNSSLLAGSINFRVRVDGSNDFSATVASAVNANDTPKVIAFKWLTSTTMEVWVDGVQKTPTYTNIGTTAPTATLSEFSMAVLNRNVRGAWTEGQAANQVMLYARIPSNDVDLAKLTRSPRDAFELFQPRRERLPIGVAGVTITRPNSDVSVSGWTPSTGSTIFGVIDESAYNDADFAISPSLSSASPATMGLNNSLSAGSYTVRVRGFRTDSVGQLRIHLLDGSGSIVGSSSWQSLTGSYATYSLPVTTTGTATRVQIEVST